MAKMRRIMISLLRPCAMMLLIMAAMLACRLQLPPTSRETTGAVCSGGDEVVALLLDPNLVDEIRSNLSQFETDLCSDGYTVVEHVSGFADPDDLRMYLASLYGETGQELVGALLIGDFPHAYQWITMTYTNPDIPTHSQEVVSLQFYSDLDGDFASSPGYVSPGGHAHSYDIHTGDVNWEIWIGLLPMYHDDYAITAEAINRYFEKNNAYRGGNYHIPRGFLQISEHHSVSTLQEHNQLLQDFQTGPYAWTPFSTAPNALFYFDSSPVGLSVGQGYLSLSAGMADFTVGDAHGFWGGHGEIDVAWVESHPVETVFFWSNGCAVGNLDYADNFLTSVLYSPTSLVLAAKGTTNDSGGLGTNQAGFFGHNIATAMSQHESLGEAILNHVNVPLIWPWSDSREVHYSTSIVLGDPTLRLPP